MILTILTLIVGGLLALLVGSKSERGAQVLATLSLLGALFLNVLLLFQVIAVHSVQHVYVWIGSGTNVIMNLGFLGDGLSAPIALLIVGLGLFSVVYSFGYMNDLHRPGLYYSLMVWFVAAMVGVVYATNLLQFFVFYELMLLPAFLLIYVYGVSEDAAEREKNAIQFWVWTAVGGLISLFAVLMIWGTVMTDSSFVASLGSASPLDLDALYSYSFPVDTAKLIGVIFLLGFGIKLGLVPLHIWAPLAYREAPIPVLVLLSGAMTKTAAYGVIRIVIPLFLSVLKDFSTGLLVISLITMFYGAILAISQKDLKMMLAYSSISQLGYLMFGYSSMTIIGVNGAAFQLINHGILASLMFFCAGAIKMKTGTMEFAKLGGLAPKMPVLATIFVTGSLALAGTPPLSAFAGEWMIFAGVAQRTVMGTIGQPYYLVLTVLGVIATGLTAGYYLWAVRRVFFGQVPETLSGVTDGPRTPLVIGAILTFFVILLGVYPALLWNIVMPVINNLGSLGGGV